MHRRTRIVLALFAAALVGGCTGDSSSGNRSFVPTAPSRVTSGFPSIDLQIATLFPTGLETAAGVQWRNVTTKLSAGDRVTGEKMFWDLVDWMLKKSGRLIDPAGPVTSLQALNQLVGDMYAVVFPGSVRPNPTLNGDATIGLIFPGAASTIVTPTHRAGIAVQAGSVAQPTLVVIDQNPQGFGSHCAGPLQTSLCQYPMFYRIEEFPHVRLLKPGRAAVCHVNPGTFAPPEGIHDRFRLAHDAPEVLSPNGIRVDGVEILKLVDVSDFMVCTDVEYTVIGARTGNKFLDNGLAAVNGALTEIKDFFTPKSAYAIDRGGGGEFSDFSNFNVVDPVRPPTIDFETFPGGGSTSPSCDAPCDLSTQYANLGVTFDFVPTIGNESIGHASLGASTNDPLGTPTHQVVNAANTGEGGGYLDGTIIMRYTNATSVTFVLRVNNSAPPVPITAYGPLPVEGEPAQIPAGQITRSDAVVYGCSDCVKFRQETITVTNASGISRIELAGGIYLLLVDDMTIVAPPPIP